MRVIVGDTNLARFGAVSSRRVYGRVSLIVGLETYDPTTNSPRCMLTCA